MAGEYAGIFCGSLIFLSAAFLIKLRDWVTYWFVVVAAGILVVMFVVGRKVRGRDGKNKVIF